ncbi:hypothetical protein ACMHYJ_12105 [Castellaniella hirudinis]|uniref:hypothetical protein n=1 Tax=Castellaniella hirudinis TaxID=1144617 RepID=UPI0039C3D919
MKTEHLTVATSPTFKAFLLRQARLQNIDVSELIRRQFHPPAETATLRLLTHQLRQATKRADKALDASLQAIEDTQTRIQQLRAAARKESQ